MYTQTQTQTGHTFLFTVGGLSFYEHGTHGDESDLLVKHNGTFLHSGFYEKPDQYEAEDLRISLTR